MIISVLKLRWISLWQTESSDREPSCESSIPATYSVVFTCDNNTYKVLWLVVPIYESAKKAKNSGIGMQY